MAEPECKVDLVHCDLYQSGAFLIPAKRGRRTLHSDFSLAFQCQTIQAANAGMRQKIAASKMRVAIGSQSIRGFQNASRNLFNSASGIAYQ